jgi:hypothetical protein
MIFDFLHQHRDAALSLTMEGGITPLVEMDQTHNRAVFKCGRRTGRTRGELNTIDSSIRMRYEVDGRDVLVQGRTLVVVPPGKTSKWRGSIHDQPVVFGTKGDSGSLVFDYKGRVLGTYIGGQLPEEYMVTPSIDTPSIDGIHFVAPIHPTLEAIRAAVRQDAAFDGLDVKVDILWGSPEF